MSEILVPPPVFPLPPGHGCAEAESYCAAVGAKLHACEPPYYDCAIQDVLPPNTPGGPQQPPPQPAGKSRARNYLLLVGGFGVALGALAAVSWYTGR